MTTKFSKKRSENTHSNQSTIKVNDPTLARLLRGQGGFVLPHDPNNGLVILLRGKAGTGKSTLALQLLHLMVTNAPRCYFTLEQSKVDLQMKLASMLAARAIHSALKPVYPSETDPKGYFSYDPEDLCKHLQEAAGLENTACLQVNNDCSSLSFPLYEEPSGESKLRIEDFQRRLKLQLWESLKESDHIQMYDISGGDRVVHESRVIHQMLDKITEKKRRRNEHDRSVLPIVVVDGLSLLSKSEGERDAVGPQRLVDLMRRRFQLGIMVYEPNEEESLNLDHHADMVIELERRTIERPLAYTIHELGIKKSRYQEAALGQHQFKIRDSGITVFPSLHFQVHHYNYMELELKRSSNASWKTSESGHKRTETPDSGSLIDLIFNPQSGESVVLLGSRNSFKTQLCLDFLSRGNWGCPNPATEKQVEREQGLLFSLIDNAPNIERGLACPWKNNLFQACGDCCGKECTKSSLEHARPFCQRPGCITPAEFFHYVKQRVNLMPTLDSENGKSHRIVFWDLTQMDYRFPLFKEDKMLLPALMDSFRTERMKALFMGAGNADNTKAASAMADHVLFCWRSNLISKERENVIGKPISSLMLYVDRTSAVSGLSGKALYCIPVYAGDKLQIPATAKELNDYVLSPSSLKAGGDKRQIERITNMQGVA